MSGTVQIHELVRDRYAGVARRLLDRDPAAGGCCGDDCCGGPVVDGYDPAELGELPADAVRASLGSGDPLSVADLRLGERVIDLGSGGGIDALLAARRVGRTGSVIGVDMTPEMLELARRTSAAAGVQDVVQFRGGTIEALPLPDASADVVLSNCVLNLAADKAAAFSEMFRVLAPGGRIAVSDIVADDHLSPADRLDRGSYAGCIAGALSEPEYRAGLTAAGFADVGVEITGDAGPGMHTALIRARRP